MNQNVFNCESCPLAKEHITSVFIYYHCRVAEEIQRFTKDEEPALKPAPAKCPLRKEPVIITLI